MARKVKKKGSTVKAKPLPLEIDRQEYIDLLYGCKYLRHRVAIMLGWECGKVFNCECDEQFDDALEVSKEC